MANKPHTEFPVPSGTFLDFSNPGEVGMPLPAADMGVQGIGGLMQQGDMARMHNTAVGAGGFSRYRPSAGRADKHGSNVPANVHDDSDYFPVENP